jgi:hypothetical protein
MPLTLNQFLLLVLTFAAVILVTFLVALLIQLRRTALKASTAIEEFGELAKRLNQATAKVEGKLEDVDSLIKTTKKAADGLSEVAWFATTKLIRPSSKFWPYIFPFIKWGWRQMHQQKQKKEGLDV